MEYLKTENALGLGTVHLFYLHTSGTVTKTNLIEAVLAIILSIVEILLLSHRILLSYLRIKLRQNEL